MLNIIDDYGMSGAIEYIYKNGCNWFILHYIKEVDAIKNCPAGYSVQRYTTTKQIRW